MWKIPYGLAVLYMALSLLVTTETSSAAELQTHKNSINMEFVLIPAGSFMMGTYPNFTDPDFEEGDRYEAPPHKVTISKPFYLGKYEVTQAQWEAVMGDNPSKFKDPNNPVEHVSWNNVQVFISKLNQREGHNRYRLPTEAEWEYAVRAGTRSAYFFGDYKSDLAWYAWYEGDFHTGSTHPVGGKEPNPWGLHDMYGNVNEWVQDWYDGEYYAHSPGTDPEGPANGSSRVLRGGSWFDLAKYCRSGRRGSAEPYAQADIFGLRLALSPE